MGGLVCSLIALQFVSVGNNNNIMKMSEINELAFKFCLKNKMPPPPTPPEHLFYVLCSIFIIVPARMQLAVTHVNAVAGGGGPFYKISGPAPALDSTLLLAVQCVDSLLVMVTRDKINCGWQQLVISGV